MIGKRYLWFPVIALLAGLCLSCGQDKGAGPDEGTLFKVELEHYFSSYDDDTSKLAISSSPCPNASNNSTMSGLDISGEWVMVSVDVPEDGTYRPHLDYASDPGDMIAVKLEMDECGTSTAANFLLTEGTGTGWKPNYHDAAGSSTLSLTAGECTLKLTLVSGELANYDCISFWPQ